MNSNEYRAAWKSFPGSRVQKSPGFSLQSIRRKVFARQLVHSLFRTEKEHDSILHLRSRLSRKSVCAARLLLLGTHLFTLYIPSFSSLWLLEKLLRAAALYLVFLI